MKVCSLLAHLIQQEKFAEFMPEKDETDKELNIQSTDRHRREKEFKESKSPRNQAAWFIWDNITSTGWCGLSLVYLFS